MNDLSDFTPQVESKPTKHSSNLVVLPGDDADEQFEACYNKTVMDLYTVLKLLDEWNDVGDAMAGKELRIILGSAYGEFTDLRHRTHSYLKDWDLSNLVESPDVEVINGVIAD